MNRRFVPWLLAMILTTLFCLLIDLVVRQSYRQSANDPQIQIAEDVAAAFSNNQFTNETLKSSFETFVPSKMQVDIGSSLSPWIQVYNESGDPLESSARIDEAQSTPHVPKSIFVTQGFSLGSKQSSNEKRLTWQSQKGIRQAIVVTKFEGLRSGYIVVGRSLREVEDRILDLHKMITIGWLMMMLMVGSAAAWNFGYFTQFTKLKNPRM